MTQAVQTGAFTDQTKKQLLLADVTHITASGAINPHQPGNYVIDVAGVAAMTLAAPTSGVDDGLDIAIFSSTANAHTITTVGLIQGGSANTNVLTFAAQPGAFVQLEAYQGKWQVQSLVNVTISS